MRKSWIAVVAGLAVAACTGLVFVLQVIRVPGHVASPAADASPTEVVTTFVAAINAHDCDTAARMWTPATAESGRRWCDDLSSLTVLGPSDESPDPGGPGRVGVTVQEAVKARPFHGGRLGMDERNFGWTYILVKTSEGWRIADNGQG